MDLAARPQFGGKTPIVFLFALSVVFGCIVTCCAVDLLAQFFCWTSMAVINKANTHSKKRHGVYITKRIGGHSDWSNQEVIVSLCEPPHTRQPNPQVPSTLT